MIRFGREKAMQILREKFLGLNIAKYGNHGDITTKLSPLSRHYLKKITNFMQPYHR